MVIRYGAGGKGRRVRHINQRELLHKSRITYGESKYEQVTRVHAAGLAFHQVGHHITSTEGKSQRLLGTVTAVNYDHDY